MVEFISKKSLAAFRFTEIMSSKYLIMAALNIALRKNIAKS